MAVNHCVVGSSPTRAVGKVKMEKLVQKIKDVTGVTDITSLSNTNTASQIATQLILTCQMFSTPLIHSVYNPKTLANLVTVKEISE